MSESAEFFRSILNGRKASTAEKIQAAKALDAIERRAGAGSTIDDVSSMDLADLDAEIARVKAILDAQGIDKAS